MDSLWITVFAVLTLLVSTLYFYMFSRNKEKFMQFWGFSWIAYSCSLLCLLCYLNFPSDIFLQLRKVIDMFNLILLLFGSYSFMHVRIPAYWYRFSLYLLLLTAICMIYGFDLLSFYLPVSVYQLILTAFICYNILVRWNVPRGEKIISAAVFLMWGVSKSVMSVIEIFTDITHNIYIIEILLSNVINFCILTIYIVYTRKEGSLASDLYKTVVENSQNVIFYYRTAPYRAFEYISPSVETITGFRPSQFYDDPAFYRNLMPESHTNDFDDMFTFSENGRKEHILELVRRNGESFWGQLSLSSISEPGGGKAIEGTLSDITESKSAELEQIEATRSRNMLLSYISHELRSPITSIAGYLTAISDGTMEGDEEVKEALDIITSRTFTLKKLIDDLDQLTKLETHQFSFDFMEYNAADVADHLMENNLGEARSEGFTVHTEADMSLLRGFTVIIDIDRIDQVFSNLITNAVKYSGHRKKLDIAFKTDETVENFLVSVKDRGIGIDEQHISHVFDRFYRGEAGENGEKEGRGLGLTLCREIINAHQGQIYAESVYGAGSTFTFIIPLYKEA